MTSKTTLIIMAVACLFALVTYPCILHRLSSPSGIGSMENDVDRANHVRKKLPSRQLNEKRLQIVLEAALINITYANLTDRHGTHPHMGARDENGNWGYVHDETALQRNPPSFCFNNTDRKEFCSTKDEHYRMLTERVYVDAKTNEAAASKNKSYKRIKIFCAIYTYEGNHNRLPAIRETWGNKCDGFMAASDKTDPSLGTVDIPHEGNEEYHNMWQKVRSIWSYVYDNYYDKYDWFIMGGDDLYVLVDNLRLYLESEEIQVASNNGTYLPTGFEKFQTPLYLGRRFAEKGNMDRIFNAGGPGYTLNKAALKALVVDGLPRYFQDKKSGAEDVMIGMTFKRLGILPYETKDEDGGERYLNFRPGDQRHLEERSPEYWYTKYSIDVKWGLGHVAARSVSFHYVHPDLMRRMHAILYKYCEENNE